LRPSVHAVNDVFNGFWQSGVRSGPEGLRLGCREFVVCQRARGVQLCEVFDLICRVRRRRRILRLLLGVVGGRLIVGRRLVVVLLLLPGLFGLVVGYRPPGNRPGKERPAPCPSPESHGEILSLVGIDIAYPLASIGSSDGTGIEVIPCKLRRTRPMGHHLEEVKPHRLRSLEDLAGAAGSVPTAPGATA
jgi:hypothetical protein